MVAACFPHLVKDPELLRIFDVFVVKYNCLEQSYLSVHRDSSLISITIALNSNEEFEGGGMWVESLDQVCVYVCVYIYICMYIYIYMYIYIRHVGEVF
jgi:hypothetical protein